MKRHIQTQTKQTEKRKSIKNNESLFEISEWAIHLKQYDYWNNITGGKQFLLHWIEMNSSSSRMNRLWREQMLLSLFICEIIIICDCVRDQMENKYGVSSNEIWLTHWYHSKMSVNLVLPSNIFRCKKKQQTLPGKHRIRSIKCQ